MYWKPTDLTDALHLRAYRPDATVVAGGTLVMALPGLLRPEALLDLVAVGLDGLDVREDGVRIGATCPIERLARAALPGPLQALHEAAVAVQPGTIRRQATVGGNVVVGGSLLGPLVLLAATAEIAGPAGRRKAPVAQLGLQPGELVVAVDVPMTGQASAYDLVRRTRLGPGVVTVSLGREGTDVRGVVQAGVGLVRALGPWPLQAPPPDPGEGLDLPDDPRASAAHRRAMAAHLVRTLWPRLAGEPAGPGERP